MFLNLFCLEKIENTDGVLHLFSLFWKWASSVFFFHWFPAGGFYINKPVPLCLLRIGFVFEELHLFSR